MNILQLDAGDKKYPLNISDHFTVDIVEPKRIVPDNPVEVILERAFSNPVGTKKLAELAVGKVNVVILVCDNTRYLPQELILPLVLEQLAKAGVKNESIQIIIATGTHSPMTDDEIIKMLGDEIPAKFNVNNHNAFNQDELVFLGNSSEKNIPIYLNKHVAEADLRIAVGTVDPHIFAGYSGGNKILAVGVAGEESIAQTHNPEMMEDPNTKFGDIENNTFRNYLNEVASIVKIDFLINVVQNADKQLIAAYTGHAINAYESAVEVARKLFEVPVDKKADIVITMPKVPKTLNLYQAVRSVNSVIFLNEAIVKKEGTVILPADCPKGIGSDDFYNELAHAENPQKYIESARISGFPPEANKAFTVAKMLNHCDLIVTDTKIEKEKLNKMHIKFAETVNAALKSLERNDKKQHVIIMTDGFFTLPVFQKR